MTTKIIPGLITLLLLCTACSIDKKASTTNIIYKASANISNYVDTDAITESLFKQFRPRVVIKDLTLNDTEIDNAVRKYVQENYTPVLIENYKQIFTELKNSDREMTNCENLTPIDKNSDVLQSLCIIQNENGATINYMTNGYSKGWEKSASYTFAIKNNVATLNSIDVNMHKDTKVSINGI